MLAAIERWYPLILSFTVSCIAANFYNIYPIPELTKDILSATINISTITIGFLSATQSILLALENRQVIKDIKASGSYKKLTSYLMDAITYSFILAIVSLIGLFFDPKKLQEFYLLCFIIWLFVLSISGLSCYRVIRLCNKILRFP